MPRDEAKLTRLVLAQRLDGMRDPSSLTATRIRKALGDAHQSIIDAVAAYRSGKRGWPDDLRALRKFLGVSQELVAFVAETNTSTVCRWEKGTTAPDARQLTRICEFLSDLDIGVPEPWFSGLRLVQKTTPIGAKGHDDARRKRKSDQPSPPAEAAAASEGNARAERERAG